MNESYKTTEITTNIYEGRSINKLQNGAIPKYTFCREFNSEHTYNFSR